MGNTLSCFKSDRPSSPPNRTTTAGAATTTSHTGTTTATGGKTKTEALKDTAKSAKDTIETKAQVAKGKAEHTADVAKGKAVQGKEVAKEKAGMKDGDHTTTTSSGVKSGNQTGVTSGMDDTKMAPAGMGTKETMEPVGETPTSIPPEPIGETTPVEGMAGAGSTAVAAGVPAATGAAVPNGVARDASVGSDISDRGDVDIDPDNLIVVDEGPISGMLSPGRATSEEVYVPPKPSGEALPVQQFWDVQVEGLQHEKPQFDDAVESRDLAEPKPEVETETRGEVVEEPIDDNTPVALGAVDMSDVKDEFEDARDGTEDTAARDLELAKDAEEDIDDTVARAVVIPAESTGDSESKVGSMKAKFEQAKDEMPKAKALKKDVRDPVTGEMITIEEFKRRRKARGIVDENVKKYEGISDEAAKEQAELDAQKEALEKARREATASTDKRKSAGVAGTDLADEDVSPSATREIPKDARGMEGIPGVMPLSTTQQPSDVAAVSEEPTGGPEPAVRADPASPREASEPAPDMVSTGATEGSDSPTFEDREGGELDKGIPVVHGSDPNVEDLDKKDEGILMTGRTGLPPATGPALSQSSMNAVDAIETPEPIAAEELPKEAELSPVAEPKKDAAAAPLVAGGIVNEGIDDDVPLDEVELRKKKEEASVSEQGLLDDAPKDPLGVVPEDSVPEETFPAPEESANPATSPEPISKPVTTDSDIPPKSEPAVSEPTVSEPTLAKPVVSESVASGPTIPATTTTTTTTTTATTAAAVPATAPTTTENSTDNSPSGRFLKSIARKVSSPSRDDPGRRSTSKIRELAKRFSSKSST